MVERTQVGAARVRTRETKRTPRSASDIEDYSAPITDEPTSYVSVGAKTLAGIGIGLLAVLAGSTLIGLAAEAVLVPSLLLKAAGGIAGGGVGMAKGLKDERRKP